MIAGPVWYFVSWAIQVILATAIIALFLFGLAVVGWHLKEQWASR